MPFDGIAVRVISQELRQKLINSRVMKIYQPQKNTILMQLRSPGETFRLVISADPVYPRIHTTTADYPNPQNPPAFCMLLRKYLEPSRIMDISQVGYERIIRIDLETFHENLNSHVKSIFFELMGRHSNIVLVSDGRILDAIHRIPDEDRPRQIVPTAEYQLPPDQGKSDPESFSCEQFCEKFRLLPGNLTLAKALALSFQGLSAIAAKEIVYRAKLNPDQVKMDSNSADWQHLYSSMKEFFDSIKQGGAPTHLKTGTKPDFAAYEVTGVSGESFPSLNQLVDIFYSKRINKERVKQLSQKLQKPLSVHLARLIKKEQRQIEDLAKAEDAGLWKKYGELLTANLYQVEKGLSEIEVVDFYHPQQETITIPLETRYSPQANAQRFFKKYHKAQNSKIITARQLEKTKQERRYLEEVVTHIELSDNVEDLLEIEEELTREGYLKPDKEKGKNKKATPGRGLQFNQYLSSDGASIFVGRNNRQNDLLTFKFARPNDLWFHAQNIPGSHVIIRVEGTVTDQTLEEAALLAARFSKAKTSPKVPVDYTRRKHVRKPPAAHPGFVTYDNFSTILVNPVSEHLPKKKRP